MKEESKGVTRSLLIAEKVDVLLDEMQEDFQGYIPFDQKPSVKCPVPDYVIPLETVRFLENDRLPPAALTPELASDDTIDAPSCHRRFIPVACCPIGDSSSRGIWSNMQRSNHSDRITVAAASAAKSSKANVSDTSAVSGSIAAPRLSRTNGKKDDVHKPMLLASTVSDKHADGDENSLGTIDLDESEEKARSLFGSSMSLDISLTTPDDISEFLTGACYLCRKNLRHKIPPSHTCPSCRRCFHPECLTRHVRMMQFTSLDRAHIKQLREILAHDPKGSSPKAATAAGEGRAHPSRPVCSVDIHTQDASYGSDGFYSPTAKELASLELYCDKCYWKCCILCGTTGADLHCSCCNLWYHRNCVSYDTSGHTTPFFQNEAWKDAVDQIDTFMCSACRHDGGTYSVEKLLAVRVLSVDAINSIVQRQIASVCGDTADLQKCSASDLLDRYVSSQSDIRWMEGVHLLDRIEFLVKLHHQSYIRVKWVTMRRLLHIAKQLLVSNNMLNYLAVYRYIEREYGFDNGLPIDIFHYTEGEDDTVEFSAFRESAHDITMKASQLMLLDIIKESMAVLPRSSDLHMLVGSNTSLASMATDQGQPSEEQNCEGSSWATYAPLTSGYENYHSMTSEEFIISALPEALRSAIKNILNSVQPHILERCIRLLVSLKRLGISVGCLLPERIIARSRSAYLVKWSGSPHDQATWESLHLLQPLGRRALLHFYLSHLGLRQSSVLPFLVLGREAKPWLRPAGNEADQGGVYLRSVPPYMLLARKYFYKFQLDAINWLLFTHSVRRGIILADQMGLGKTIEVCGFLGALAAEKGCFGTHLIVAPVSTLANWQRELQTWVPFLNVGVLEVSDTASFCMIVQGSIYASLYADEFLKASSGSAYSYKPICEAPRVVISPSEHRGSRVVLRNSYRGMKRKPVQLADCAHGLRALSPSEHERLRSVVDTNTLCGDASAGAVVATFSDAATRNFNGAQRYDVLLVSYETAGYLSKAKLPPTTVLVEVAKRPGGRAGGKTRLVTHGVSSTDAFTAVQRCFGVFETLIVDEGHRLKGGPSVKSFELLDGVEANQRILLTGTPIQNNFMEFFNLLRFVDSNVFTRSVVEHLLGLAERASSVNSDAQSRKDALSRLHGFLRPHILLRSHSDVFQNPIQKVEMLVPVDLTPLQRQLYAAVLHNNRFVLLQRAGSTIQRAPILRGAIASLRHITNHPYIFFNRRKRGGDAFVARLSRQGQDPSIFARMSAKLDLLDRLLDACVRVRSRKVLIYSQFVMVLSVLEWFLARRGYRTLRLDGHTRAPERQKMIDMFNAPDSAFQVFLLSTTAGGIGINLYTSSDVVIFDSSYNPQSDMQAVHRSARIGQKNIVRVYKLFCRNTIDQKILETAKQKLTMSYILVRPLRGAKHQRPEPAAGGNDGGSGADDCFVDEELDDILAFGAADILTEETLISIGSGSIGLPEGLGAGGPTDAGREPELKTPSGDASKSSVITYDQEAIDKLVDQLPHTAPADRLDRGADAPSSPLGPHPSITDQGRIGRQEFFDAFRVANFALTTSEMENDADSRQGLPRASVDTLSARGSRGDAPGSTGKGIRQGPAASLLREGYVAPPPRRVDFWHSIFAKTMGRLLGKTNSPSVLAVATMGCSADASPVSNSAGSGEPHTAEWHIPGRVNLNTLGDVLFGPSESEASDEQPHSAAAAQNLAPDYSCDSNSVSSEGSNGDSSFQPQDHADESTDEYENRAPDTQEKPKESVASIIASDATAAGSTEAARHTECDMHSSDVTHHSSNIIPSKELSSNGLASAVPSYKLLTVTKSLLDKMSQASRATRTVSIALCNILSRIPLRSLVSVLPILEFQGIKIPLRDGEHMCNLVEPEYSDQTFSLYRNAFDAAESFHDKYLKIGHEMPQIQMALKVVDAVFISESQYARIVGAQLPIIRSLAQEQIVYNCRMVIMDKHYSTLQRMVAIAFCAPLLTSDCDNYDDLIASMNFHEANYNKIFVYINNLVRFSETIPLTRLRGKHISSFNQYQSVAMYFSQMPTFSQDIKLLLDDCSTNQMKQSCCTYANVFSFATRQVQTIKCKPVIHPSTGRYDLSLRRLMPEPATDPQQDASPVCFELLEVRCVNLNMAMLASSVESQSDTLLQLGYRKIPSLSNGNPEHVSPIPSCTSTTPENYSKKFLEKKTMLQTTHLITDSFLSYVTPTLASQSLAQFAQKVVAMWIQQAVNDAYVCLASINRIEGALNILAFRRLIVEMYLTLMCMTTRRNRAEGVGAALWVDLDLKIKDLRAHIAASQNGPELSSFDKSFDEDKSLRNYIYTYLHYMNLMAEKDLGESFEQNADSKPGLADSKILQMYSLRLIYLLAREETHEAGLPRPSRSSHNGTILRLVTRRNYLSGLANGIHAMAYLMCSLGIVPAAGIKCFLGAKKVQSFCRTTYFNEETDKWLNDILGSSKSVPGAISKQSSDKIHLAYAPIARGPPKLETDSDTSIPKTVSSLTAEYPQESESLQGMQRPTGCDIQTTSLEAQNVSMSIAQNISKVMKTGEQPRIPFINMMCWNALSALYSDKAAVKSYYLPCSTTAGDASLPALAVPSLPQHIGLFPGFFENINSVIVAKMLAVKIFLNPRSVVVHGFTMTQRWALFTYFCETGFSLQAIDYEVLKASSTFSAMEKFRALYTLLGPTVVASPSFSQQCVRLAIVFRERLVTQLAFSDEDRKIIGGDFRRIFGAFSEKDLMSASILPGNPLYVLANPLDSFISGLSSKQVNILLTSVLYNDAVTKFITSLPVLKNGTSPEASCRVRFGILGDADTKNMSFLPRAPSAIGNVISTPYSKLEEMLSASQSDAQQQGQCQKLLAGLTDFTRAVYKDQGTVLYLQDYYRQHRESLKRSGIVTNTMLQFMDNVVIDRSLALLAVMCLIGVHRYGIGNIKDIVRDTSLATILFLKLYLSGLSNDIRAGGRSSINRPRSIYDAVTPFDLIDDASTSILVFVQRFCSVILGVLLVIYMLHNNLIERGSIDPASFFKTLSQGLGIETYWWPTEPAETFVFLSQTLPSANIVNMTRITSFIDALGNVYDDMHHLIIKTLYCEYARSDRGSIRGALTRLSPPHTAISAVIAALQTAAQNGFGHAVSQNGDPNALTTLLWRQFFNNLDNRGKYLVALMTDEEKKGILKEIVRQFMG